MLTKKLRGSGLFLFALFAFTLSCNNSKNKPVVIAHKNTAPFFPFFLSDKTMIVNQEQDNTLEGHYLKITEVINDSTFRINLPADFYVTGSRIGDWMIGWPTGHPFYDAGCENLREIAAIDLETSQMTIGKLLRGNGIPHKDQRVVFWNMNPSGYHTISKNRLIEPYWWKNFGGISMEAGAVIFDSTRSQYIMYIQEVDTSQIHIYAATSGDLLNWKPVSNQPLFLPKDFGHTTWAGLAEDGKTPQTPRIYSAMFYKGMWHLFASGYGKDGKRYIGLITTTDPLKGKFTISEKPLIAPSGAYDSKGCFYPKVCKAGNHFLLYYDGMDSSGTERVCMAESDDLLNWKKYSGNPVLDEHYGWRSGPYTSEPNYVTATGDTVWLMAGGYKKYNTEFTRQDSMEGRMPMDTALFRSSEAEKGKHISGNVMDAQLGVFISLDGGHTFKPHCNNPIWVCNYSDTLQNDHCGGNFFPLNLNGDSYILYQAKSETPHRYNILLRKKEK